MTDPTPPPADRKNTLVAPVVIGVALLLLLILLLLFRQQEPPPVPQAAPAPPVQALPIPTKTDAPKGPLGRKDLIEAANAAAAAMSAGESAPESSTELKGRAFSVRLPFGCDGVAGAGQLIVERDATGRPGKLSARPGDWTSLPVLAGLGGPPPESIEGFWLARPWSLSDACPPASAGPVPAAPTPAATQTLGLAQWFEPGGSRVQRRGGRPYEFALKTPNEAVGKGDYRFVLQGRIGSFPDGRSLRCQAESPDHRPVCVIAVDVDRVAFETGAGALLAEWQP